MVVWGACPTTANFTNRLTCWITDSIVEKIQGDSERKIAIPLNSHQIF